MLQRRCVFSLDWILFRNARGRRFQVLIAILGIKGILVFFFLRLPLAFSHRRRVCTSYRPLAAAGTWESAVAFDFPRPTADAGFELDDLRGHSREYQLSVRSMGLDGGSEENSFQFSGFSVIFIYCMTCLGCKYEEGLCRVSQDLVFAFLGVLGHRAILLDRSCI